MNPQLANDPQNRVEPSGPDGKPSRKSPVHPFSPPARKRPKILGPLILLIIMAAAAFLGWKYWDKIASYFSSTSSTSAPSGGRAAGANRPVPVVAATARRGDVHIYLLGLGQVTPFETVTLHTRVDGQIMKVYFKEGEIVQKDAPLVEIDKRPYQAQLDLAKGQLLKDQAILDNAKIDLARYQQALKDGSVSDQQLATQAATVKQYEGIVESDESQIETAALNLEYCLVPAPMTGRIGLRLVDQGNIVHATDAGGLAVITEVQPIAVVFTLPEDDLPQVVGQTSGGVGLPVDAYDREDQKKMAGGVVEAVDNQVDPTTGTFKIKARFENKDNALFPNQFVNAHLLADTKKNLILIPTAAVQHGPDGGAFVYVVKSDQTVSIRPVKEGPTEGDYTSVSSVGVGEVVVTDGTDKLQDSSKVTVSISDGNGPTTRASGRRGGAGRRSATRESANPESP